jgi:hypothetical protein
MMRDTFKSMEELHADALAQVPDLTRLSRAALMEHLREYSTGAKTARDTVSKAWWTVQVTAVQGELKQRAHGKPRTRSGTRQQALRRLVGPDMAFTGRFVR